MRAADFDTWARAHHGIITFAASGLSRSAWYRALDAGALIAVHPLVARLPGAPITAEQRIIAGVLAMGEPAIASHRSAARLWGLARPDDDPVDVIVTGERRDLDLEGVVIHRPTDRHRLTPQRRFGIACSNILRTIVDLGGIEPTSIHDVIGHAVANGLASLEAIESAAAEHARRGKAGTVALRAAIDDWTIDGRPSDSLLEAAMARLVGTYALPPVEFHPVIAGHEVDFRIIDTPVLIECDGWRYHGLDRTNFERDRVRDADLTAAGWIVLRFTYRSITARPGWTAGRIRAAVARWRPDALPAPPPDAA